MKFKLSCSFYLQLLITFIGIIFLYGTANSQPNGFLLVNKIKEVKDKKDSVLPVKFNENRKYALEINRNLRNSDSFMKQLEKKLITNNYAGEFVFNWIDEKPNALVIKVSRLLPIEIINEIIKASDKEYGANLPVITTREMFYSTKSDQTIVIGGQPNALRTIDRKKIDSEINNQYNISSSFVRNGSEAIKFMFTMGELVSQYDKQFEKNPSKEVLDKRADLCDDAAYIRNSTIQQLLVFNTANAVSCQCILDQAKLYEEYGSLIDAWLCYSYIASTYAVYENNNTGPFKKINDANRKEKDKVALANTALGHLKNKLPKPPYK